MSEFLKGNFQTKRTVIEKAAEAPRSTAEELRRVALSSLGGSMVYMERNELTWDGDAEAEADKTPKSK